MTGLAYDWFGRVWLNPPYSYPLIERFAEKIVQQYSMGNVNEAIILTNNSTDTAWFHMLIDYPVCFLRGRVRFWGSDGATGAPLQGQAIFYLGMNVARFAEFFKKWGRVVAAYDTLGNGVQP